MDANGYTITERKIVAILSDGMPHSRHELAVCLLTEDPENVKHHISNLRKILRPRGEDIICEVGVSGRRTKEMKATFCYRHVRLLASPYKG